MTPDPLTLTSINYDEMMGHPCGCYNYRTPSGNERWRLCEYHNGYEDGIEAQKKAAGDTDD